MEYHNCYGTKRYSMTTEERERAVIERDTNFIGDKENRLSNFLKKDNIKQYNREVTEKCLNRTLQSISFRDEDWESLQKEVCDYFILADKHNVIPTIASLCCYLGVNKNVLYEKAHKTGFSSDVLRASIQVCHSYQELAVIHGEVSSNLFIFLSKNYYGLADSSTLNLTSIDSNVNSQETLKVIQEQLALENNDLD